jgi:tetratricopeptide (TPR) repeat protein
LYRFEDAAEAAAKAHKMDPFNAEVSAIQTNVQMMTAARIKGNKHYIEGDYLRAYDEFKVGLKYAKCNISLLSNLAACHWKLERWVKCIEICNRILQIRPDNIKALLRRADSHAKVTN